MQTYQIKPSTKHTPRACLEAEAVLLILTCSQSDEWQMLASKGIDPEITQTLDVERKKQVTLLASLL